MDLTKLRDMDSDVHQIASRLLREVFAKVGPAGQATTGTGTTIGEVDIEDLTTDGVVLVTAAEDLGDEVTIGYVTAGAGKFTVYDNTTGTPLGLDTKLINYFVIDMGTA